MSCESDNKHNITIWQGTDFGLSLTLKSANGAVQNLHSYTARMQIRPSYDSGSVTEELTSANGEITITESTGEVLLALSAARTANIAVDLTNGVPPKSIYVYDVELIDADSKVSKLVWGTATVFGEVTR